MTLTWPVGAVPAADRPGRRHVAAGQGGRRAQDHPRRRRRRPPGSAPRPKLVWIRKPRSWRWCRPAGRRAAPAVPAARRAQCRPAVELVGRATAARARSRPASRWCPGPPRAVPHRDGREPAGRQPAVGAGQLVQGEGAGLPQRHLRGRLVHPRRRRCGRHRRPGQGGERPAARRRTGRPARGGACLPTVAPGGTGRVSPRRRRRRAAARTRSTARWSVAPTARDPERRPQAVRRAESRRRPARRAALTPWVTVDSEALTRASMSRGTSLSTNAPVLTSKSMIAMPTTTSLASRTRAPASAGRGRPGTRSCRGEERRAEHDGAAAADPVRRPAVPPARRPASRPRRRRSPRRSSAA